MTEIKIRRGNAKEYNLVSGNMISLRACASQCTTSWLEEMQSRDAQRTKGDVGWKNQNTETWGVRCMEEKTTRLATRDQRPLPTENRCRSPKGPLTGGFAVVADLYALQGTHVRQRDLELVGLRGKEVRERFGFIRSHIILAQMSHITAKLLQSSALLTWPFRKGKRFVLDSDSFTSSVRPRPPYNVMETSAFVLAPMCVPVITRIR